MTNYQNAAISNGTPPAERNAQPWGKPAAAIPAPWVIPKPAPQPTNDANLTARPEFFTPTLQAKVLEIAKNFSAGPSSAVLHRAAQRLAEAELMHQHSVALLSKLALIPWEGKRFMAMELQGLTASCDMWESNVD